jgi:hypothetical protein
VGWYLVVSLAMDLLVLGSDGAHTRDIWCVKCCTPFTGMCFIQNWCMVTMHTNSSGVYQVCTPENLAFLVCKVVHTKMFGVHLRAHLIVWFVPGCTPNILVCTASVPQFGVHEAKSWCAFYRLPQIHSMNSNPFFNAKC